MCNISDTFSLIEPIFKYEIGMYLRYKKKKKKCSICSKINKAM